MSSSDLVEALTEAGIDADDQLSAFLEWVDSTGVTLYQAQEEAVLEVFSDTNVILNTPTGSGKSLVALAAHARAIGTNRRSWYTAPIKALVSEKFFELCSILGAQQVGMITGDGSVNADAPVICCTAEILANLALRHGRKAPVDHVCMDEFHFYAEPDRGWAWQVPLLELTGARFLLMSATLGSTAFFEEELTRRTGRPTRVIRSSDRPVPLSFEYRRTPLHETLQQLVDTDRAPVYLVHFTQQAATEQAQALTSIDLLSKSDRRELVEAIGDFRFDSPFGRDLKRFLRAGVGVHHAGLLPKYRRLVERLAQAGHLRVISGTDTLGVGVNVPIRSVLFTQLCKFDGTETRILRVREFQQIAGRAGRRGFDTEGHVWAQAPSHEIENLRADAKATASGKKNRKGTKAKPPPRGYKHWSEDTFIRLRDGLPETLTSSFQVSHSMVLEVLDRPGDGCRALRDLLVENHEPRTRQRDQIRRAIQIYRSLKANGVLEILDAPDDLDRLVRVDLDLQMDFRLNHPLSPFVLEMLHLLDPNDPDDPHHELSVLTVVESTLEDPGVVLLRQRDKAKDELIARLKSEGVEYEERMERLAEVTHPKPMADLLYAAFNQFRLSHPWVAGENVRPKSVARDLFERAMTFGEYVSHYGLKRSEGVLLRYLTDAYKALVQSVPEDAKTEEILDLTSWLGEVVRQVDSSLLAEWEQLVAGEPMLAQTVVSAEDTESGRPDITANARAFRVMVRNEVFRWVALLARREYGRLSVALAGPDRDTLDHSIPRRDPMVQWTPEDLASALDPYWEDHEEILTDQNARGAPHFQVDDASSDHWIVNQTLLDPAEFGEWRLLARVDLAQSRIEGRAFVDLLDIGPHGDPSSHLLQSHDVPT